MTLLLFTILCPSSSYSVTLLRKQRSTSPNAHSVIGRCALIRVLICKTLTAQILTTLPRLLTQTIFVCFGNKVYLAPSTHQGHLLQEEGWYSQSNRRKVPLSVFQTPTSMTRRDRPLQRRAFPLQLLVQTISIDSLLRNES